MAASRELISLISSARGVDAFSRQYERVIERIVGELTAGVSRPGGARAGELIGQLNSIIDNIDPRKASAVRSWIRREIPRAFVLGDRAATRQLREELERANAAKAADFGQVGGSFTAINSTAMRAVVSAMTNTTAQAASQVRALVGSVVRRTQVTLIQNQQIREATVSGVIRGATGRQVADDIASILLRGKIKPEVADRLRAVGFRGDMFRDFEAIARGQMITVGGRRMNVRDYADMVARTQMREAHKIGTVIRLQQHGVDHVRISRHPQAKADECTPYAGNVFYIGSEEVDPLGFPRLSEIVNGGPPFHPNCRHVLIPFVTTLESQEVIGKAKTAIDLLPRRFLGKGPGDVRDLVAELTQKELEKIAPAGVEDLRKGVA